MQRADAPDTEQKILKKGGEIQHGSGLGSAPDGANHWRAPF